MGKNSGVQWGIERNFYSCGFWQGCRQTSDRIFRVENAKRDLLKWNRAEAKAGTKGVVFINPQADFFEENDDKEWRRARDRAFETMAMCKALFFLILTKRANFMRYEMGRRVDAIDRSNIAFGVTVEAPQFAEERIGELLRVDCAMRFVSCEPLRGPVDFSSWRYSQCPDCSEIEPSPTCPEKSYCDKCERVVRWQTRLPLDWVIVGGESGPHARPTNPDWVRSIRNQCAEYGVPFLFKGWSEPQAQAANRAGSHHRLGKNSGRLLDGHEHMEIPEVLK